MLNLVKNIGYQSVVQVVNYIFPLITVPYVSRIIGPESYGIINYATVFMAYFVMLIGYGFDLTGTRRIAQGPDDINYRNKVYSEILNARVVLFFFSCIIFLICVVTIEPLKQDLRVTILLFLMCLSNMLVPNYIYQGMQNLLVFAKTNFVRSLIYTLLIFVFIKEKNDYIYIVTINVVLTLSISLFLIFYAKRKYNLKFDFIPFKETLVFIWNERIVFFSTVVISLYTTTNVVLLGFFDTMENVAYFTTSQNLVNITATVLTAPMSAALYPYLSSSFAISKQNGLDTAKKILPVIFYFLLISCFTLFLLAPFIVNILYGKEFQNSIFPMQIMAFAPFVIALSNFFGIQIMLNLKLDKLFLKIVSLCSVFGLIFNFLMSKQWGYVGTAFNVIIVELVVTCAVYIGLKRRGIELVSSSNFKPRIVWNYLKLSVRLNK
jgi:O-antigen/teichoic acid export membrane protein